jgi:hypothetical protein
MKTTEKQFNIWSVQDQLSTLSSQKQLDFKLKVYRDQYIQQLLINKKMDESNHNLFNTKEKLKVKKIHKKCTIL